jgi:predicted AAA+ superfamily ATPase
LAGRTGNLLNLQEIAKEIGIVHATVKSWLSILETSRIIYILRPYFGNIPKRMVKTPKIYFVDTGLLSHLLGYQTPETLLLGPASGAVFENMIVMDVLKNKFNHTTGENLYFYRDSNAIETDLVIEKNNEFTLIEIKASKSLQHESAKQLMKIPLKSNKRIILSLIDKESPLSKEVTQLPWWVHIK